MIFIICFLLLLIFIIFIYLEFCTSPNEPLHKYYEIRNESVYAKMDIPEFTDLGVISVHGDGVTRSKDVVNNKIHYTENNLQWRKHRELGKYIKHSESPNCEVYHSSPLSFGLRTKKKIHMNDELVTDYYPLDLFYNMKV